MEPRGPSLETQEDQEGEANSRQGASGESAPQPVSSRLLRPLFLALSFAPFGLVLFSGALTSSLWLDEIIYHYYEDNLKFRAIEFGRPNSWYAPYFSMFNFCDLQRGVRFLIAVVAGNATVPIEVSVRLISVVSASLLLLITYRTALREGLSEVNALVATLLVGTSPLLLHFAFEGRVYSLAALLAVAYLLTLRKALDPKPSPGPWLALAILLGILLQRANWWTVCIPAMLVAMGTWDLIRSRAWNRRLTNLVACTAPGLILAAGEYLFVISPGGEPGGHQFPLHAPRGIWAALFSTIGASWAPIGAPGLEHTIWILYLAAIAILALVAISVRTETARRWYPYSIATAGCLSVTASILLGGHFGAMVFGRHQVPMMVLLLFGIGLTPGRPAAILKVVLICINLVFLTNTIERSNQKGNGKGIAAIVEEQAAGTKNPAIVIQHSLRLEYPDPLNSFGADFYLNGLSRTTRTIPIYELPDHRRVSGERTVYRYFTGGEALLEKYSQRPIDQWVSWLRMSGHDVIWFVWPNPSNLVEAPQANDYLHALKEAGYHPRIEGTYFLNAYPPSVIQRFVR